ncbi:MAG TPA: hypothetical protein PKW43_01660, partial [Deltaproteobacteria bacterium]|nr:hypothetical protein [Deltaproteobacteria bacterium]
KIQALLSVHGSHWREEVKVPDIQGSMIRHAGKTRLLKSSRKGHRPCDLTTYQPFTCMTAGKSPSVRTSNIPISDTTSGSLGALTSNKGMKHGCLEKTSLDKDCITL